MKNEMERLIALAEEQVGYQEKKSAMYLDDPDANAGYGNYTKYARDVDNWGLAGCQGQPWCATYQFWLEARIFGTETALKHFHMERQDYRGYNCFCIYEAFEKAGKTSDQPQTGCLVVFKHSHIGRVIRIGKGRIYTNEGNTSALYGDKNGGTVKNKDYAIGDSSILGYCLMDYVKTDRIPEDSAAIKPEQNEHFTGVYGKEIREVRVESYQRWLNTWYPGLLSRVFGEMLDEDGRYGKKTRNASLAVWKDMLNRLWNCDLTPGDPAFGEKCHAYASNAKIKKGDTGTLPAIAEGILAAGGYYSGNIDAIYGEKLEEAVTCFQKEHGLIPDGIIGKETWKGLFTIF